VPWASLTVPSTAIGRRTTRLPSRSAIQAAKPPRPEVADRVLAPQVTEIGIWPGTSVEAADAAAGRARAASAGDGEGEPAAGRA
jgi:hypothetical protein